MFINTRNLSIKEADNELTLKLTIASLILIIGHSHKLLSLHEKTERYDTVPDKEELN